jgi:hypothetical protein
MSNKNYVTICTLVRFLSLCSLLLCINSRYPDDIAASIKWSLGCVVASFVIMYFLESVEPNENMDPKSVPAVLNLWTPLILCIAAIFAMDAYSLEPESVSWVMIVLAFQTGQQVANIWSCLGSKGT